MSRARLVLVCLALALVAAGVAAGQGPLSGPPGERRPPADHQTELVCGNCHQGQHHGIGQMYLGLGGRGTPMIPSHMFQVRVQCVACHTVPKAEERAARIVGQTFRPSEQACVGCHGEQYRGMLQRWVQTLERMRAIVLPKLTAARAALSAVDPKHPRLARARKLVDDADHNLTFVTLAKGVHNVFYAADLLKLANGWLDEAASTLGKPLGQSDDALVRGGYCGVLCHEQAGVKLPAAVTFGQQKIPHARHVSEFGAVCTACHSAEVHKAVSATAATCTSCHHAPQNERCESCHRAQSAFYRGQLEPSLGKVEPNSMVNAVTCTGCHDLARKHSRTAVGDKCVGCHEAAYTSFLHDWTAGLDTAAARIDAALKRAEAALARERRAGRRLPEAESLTKEARAALALVRTARGAHNPAGAEALLDAARQKADAALAQAERR
jgi:hypothetical protein